MTVTVNAFYFRTRRLRRDGMALRSQPKGRIEQEGRQRDSLFETSLAFSLAPCQVAFQLGIQA